MQTNFIKAKGDTKYRWISHVFTESFVSVFCFSQKLKMNLIFLLINALKGW